VIVCEEMQKGGYYEMKKKHYFIVLLGLFVIGITVESNKKSILKLFYWYENELYIKILFYDPDYKEVRSWTYLPIKQYAISPDKRFSKSYEIVDNDNIMTIKLINIKNNSLPAEQFLSDEILYSYYKNF